MPRTKRLTPKESELIRLKVQGETHKDAYHKVYSPTAKDSTAVSNTDKILNKPHVKTALENALIKHNITIDRALAPIAKGLEVKKENGEDDIHAQLKASDRALKLLGVNNSGGDGSIHFHLHQAKQKYNL